MGVDKSIAKAVSAAMIHMVRNSIDHGIETPEGRQAKGKPSEGLISITASESQGNIQISVRDDGGGINRDKVLKRALQNGLVSESQAASMSDSEVYELLFLPGFSTAEKVTSVSGRGVGMDVVRSGISALNGKIRIESKLGEGSAFLLTIPVPKAVMVEQTLLCRTEGHILAIPLNAITHIGLYRKLVIHQAGQLRMCKYLGRTVPLMSYSELTRQPAGVSEEEIEQAQTVIVHFKGRYLALVVSKVVGQLEAVVREFNPLIGSLPGFTGTTVLGDGTIAYIVSAEQIFGLLSRFEHLVDEFHFRESEGHRGVA